MNKYKSFLCKTLFCLISIIVAYIALFFLLVDMGSIQFESYKNTLLQENKNNKKIIIESGSNSYHGINSKMIQDHFNIKTINLAEFAGVPLKFKLLRLLNTLNDKDIVILPLEYRYYTGDTTIDMFYDSIFFGYSHYFYALDFKQKIKFIFSVPISSVAKAINTLRKRKYIKDYLRAKIKNIYPEHVKADGKKFMLDNGDYDFKEKLEEKIDMQTPCQYYIFTKSITDKNNVISQTFKENLEILKNVQNRTKAQFIFTYPVVAGDASCYDFSTPQGAEFEKFLNDIKQYVKNNGFKFIGNYKDSFFDRKDTMDTWFHVMPNARDERTKRLIKNIEKENLIK